MFSPSAVQYSSRLTEVPKMENDLVLDLSIRTQEDSNMCHGEPIYSDERFLSPDIRSNHSNDSNGSPTFLPLPANGAVRRGKPTRPFKAYPKNFLGLGMTEGIIDDSSMRYIEFRRQFLSQLHATNGGNKNMKRPVQSVSPNQVPSSSGDAKDQAYWERRRKNNEAAKKSRDARRAKEDEIAIRAAFLERENLQLRLELASLKGEVERLRCVVYANN
ncbi:hypothetical protein RUM43_001598 [Polyplax serrata]|uniref:BZIP domain-containing protein n=1 Tax=Polyplax serrata TaxID=468196 RepID=A0AAN8SI43_POLSC